MIKEFFEKLKKRKAWIVEISIVMFVFVFFTDLLFEKFADFRMVASGDSVWEVLFLSAGIMVAVIPVFHLLFQSVLVCFYKPETHWPSGRPLPGCTVIVPAYNEGEHVAQTLESLLKSDYPKDKLEIIAINDGSADDTWQWIKLVADKSEGIIRPVNLERNGGKKHALYMGFNEAKHDLVLTIDSDSIVQVDTIRNLIIPFQHQQVGGAAGVVRVRNINNGLIPRMLDICFVFSCDFMRSAQSTIGSVLCSPGAISAYRKAALLPHLDKWLNQKFLGKPSNIGEDRALTSILLKNGYHVVLQNNALVETCVPENYRQLCKTLIRWTRGDVREGLLMVGHFFRKHGGFRITALKINIVCQLFSLITPLLLLPSTIYLICTHGDNLIFILYYMVVAAWLWASIPAILYAQRESPLKSLWAFVYAIFGLLALSWICTYSWITMNNSKWMTRNSKKADTSEVESVSSRIS